MQEVYETLGDRLSSNQKHKEYHESETCSITNSFCITGKCDLSIVAHTLPSTTFVDGLLGMDFLTRCQAVISVADAQIRIPQSV